MTSISIRRKSKGFNYQMYHNKRRKPWRRRGNFGKGNRDKYRFSFQEFRRTLKAGRSFRYDFRWLDYPSSYAFLHAAQLHTKHGFLPVRWWRYNKISRPYLSIVDSKEHAPKEEFRFSFCERTRWNATKTTTEESRWVISRKIRDKMTFPPELARNCANKIALSFPGCETPRQSKTVSVPFKHSSTILPPFDRLIIPER